MREAEFYPAFFDAEGRFAMRILPDAELIRLTAVGYDDKMVNTDTINIGDTVILYMKPRHTSCPGFLFLFKRVSIKK